MADNNIIIKITSEANLDAAQKQMKELTERAKEQEQAMRDLSDVEKQDAESIKQLGLSQEQLAKALKKNKDYYRELKDHKKAETAETKKSIASLKEQVNQYNMLQGAGVRLRSQLTAIREEMVRMAEGGDITSSRFIEMADKAAALSDTLGDAQAAINLLASDTKNLDAAMQIGGGLTGTFNAATAAMALLGGESEQLQQAFYKMQAAMSLLQGVQQALTVLDKRSAANIVLRTAALKIYNKIKGEQTAATVAATAAEGADTAAMAANTAATNAATVATRGWTAALLANPVAIIVTAFAGLAAAFFAVKGKIDKMKEAAKEANEELARLRGEYADFHTQEKLSQVNESTAASYNALGMQIREYTYQLEIAEQEQKAFENSRNKTMEDVKAYNKRFKETIPTLQAHIEALERQQAELLDTAIATGQTKAAEEAEALALERQRAARERAIQQMEDEIAVRQALASVSENRGGSGMYVPIVREEEENDGVADFNAMVENMALRKQLEGETEQEIADWKYSIVSAYLQDKIALEEAAGRDTTEIENELMQLMIDNSERVAQTERENIEATQALQREKLEEAIQIASYVIDTVGQMADSVFGAVSDQIDAQIAHLDEMYTTDAQEAKENANKKYISEQEYEKKKAALEMKQAKYAKAQAMFNIGLQTAQAIMQAMVMFGPPPSPMGIAGIALATSLGAIQLAAVAAKPLAQYEKGRKGGKGEYALVGEKGPELMYVPQGASIVPNNKLNNMAAWGDYGVPKLPMPVLPDVSPDVLEQALAFSPMTIDYDRLGQAVAKAMPKQRAVNVNVDRSGVTVQSGNDTHTYLNKKYNGAWN